MAKKVDIIVSCFNEEGNILPFFNETKKYLNDKKYKYNIVYVNDGSSDGTYDEVEKIIKKTKKSKSGPNVSIISFKRNFGHEAAMCAGLENSKADYLIFMDVDLQNPPKKIPEIMKAFEKGADIVLMRRIKYVTSSFLKKFTSNAYYLFSSKILRNKNERNVSDFFAIDKDVAKRVKEKYKTRLRFIRSFVQFESKHKGIVDYINAQRNIGESRYNYWKLTKLAIESELCRCKFLRDLYKSSKNNPIYVIDKKRSH